MAKVVTARLKRESAKTKPPVKLVVGPDGHTTKLWTVDAGSDSFTDDLRSAFTQNVRRVRRENRRLLGAVDFAPGKP